MQFRNLRAEELEGSVDLPGFQEWLRSIGATDTRVLIVAPPGTGKAAAVGWLAHRLDRKVILCDLTELLEYEDPVRQLDNLLRICQAQRNTVVYLDKLDRALVAAEGAGTAGELTEHLVQWFGGAHEGMLDAECTVVCTGREADRVPATLRSCFEKQFLAA